MTKRIDLETVKKVLGTHYPSPFDQPCRARERRRLGDEAGLTQFGVNYLRLPPGAWSSQRHWHTSSDEFIFVIAGEVVLVTDGGDEILRAGDGAGFKANDADGHCLQNRSDADVCVLEIGTRIYDDDDAVDYPGIDMILPAAPEFTGYSHRDGTPYES